MKAFTSLIVLVIMVATGCGSAENLTLRQRDHESTSQDGLSLKASTATCRDQTTATFKQISDVLGSFNATLTSIAERDFAGYRAEAIVRAGEAQGQVAEALKVTESDCTQATSKAITNPVVLPAQAGKNGPELFVQSGRLTQSINDLRVTITQRDFEGHRQAAAASLRQALTDLQAAIYAEACHDHPENSFCAAGKTSSFLWKGNVVAQRCGALTNGFKGTFWLQPDAGINCFSTYAARLLDKPACEVSSFVYTDGVTYERRCGCGQPEEAGFYRNGSKSGNACFDKGIYNPAKK